MSAHCLQHISEMSFKTSKLFIRVSLVLCFFSFCTGFIPEIQYLIKCGGLPVTKINNRAFVSDVSSKFLSTPESILVNSNSSSSDSPLYWSTRVFTGISKYSFPIIPTRRYWIRLYFHHFASKEYKSSSANFSVSAQDFELLRNYVPGNNTLIKEYLVNVTKSILEITISPSENSIAFLNALEVVSVPHTLITDDATLVNPRTKFSGLPWQALETIVRANMGGPTISLANDTLFRSWVSDQAFLIDKNLATNVSNIGAVKFPKGGANPDTAPASVYGTCVRMNSNDDPNSNFNITWEFNVDPGFRYFMRFHFCDIVSTVVNSLLFNVYIDSYNVVENLDPSALNLNVLASAFYMDFVSPVNDNNKIRISIGPSSIESVYPNAILNGLEIMKMATSSS